jgi:hypothetical protein
MDASTSRRAVIALGVLVLTFSASASTVLAAAKAGLGASAPHISASSAQALEVAPTGDGASEDECKRYEVAINSWREEVLDRVLAGDNKGAGTANNNVKGLENEATDAGCFIIY